MLDFTHKTEKDMLDHLKKQCLSFKNTEKNDQLKETEFLWNPENDIVVYFTELHKKQELLEKSVLTGMTHKKPHRWSYKCTPANCLTRKI